MDHNAFREATEIGAETDGHQDVQVRTQRRSGAAVSESDEEAERVVKKVHKRGRGGRSSSAGCSRCRWAGRPPSSSTRPDTSLRDTEQMPLLEEGGIDALYEREVLPVRAGCVDGQRQDQGGLRDLVQPGVLQAAAALRSLAEIRADIEALERETDGLLDDVLVETEPQA